MKVFRLKNGTGIQYGSFSIEDIGISALTAYLGLFVYVYISMYNAKKFGIKKNKSILISDAFQYAEPIGSSILLLFYVSLVMWLLAEQDFQRKPEGIIIITINALFPFLFLFFTMTSYKRTSAWIMFLFGTIFSILTMIMCKDKIETHDIQNIINNTYFLCAVFGIITILYIITCKYPSLKPLLGIFELAHIIAFGTFIYIESTCPSFQHDHGLLGNAVIDKKPFRN